MTAVLPYCMAFEPWMIEATEVVQPANAIPHIDAIDVNSGPSASDLAIVTDPSDANGRGMLRYAPAGGLAGASDRLSLQFKPRITEHNTAIPGVATADSDALGPVVFQFIVKPTFDSQPTTSNQVQVLRGEDGSTQLLGVGIGAGGVWRVYDPDGPAWVNATGSLAAVSGTTYRITVCYQPSTGSNGILRVWIDGTLIYDDSTHTQTTSVTIVEARAQAPGGGYSVASNYTPHLIACIARPVSHVDLQYGVDLTTEAITAAMYADETGICPLNTAIGQCRDVSRTEARIFAAANPARYRNAWAGADVRVFARYDAGGTYTGGSQTSAVAIGDDVLGSVTVPITGLSARQQYTYRLWAYNHDTDPSASSPVQICGDRTLTTAPSSRVDHVLGFAGCQDATCGKPWAHYRRMIDTDGVDAIVVADDLVYHDSGFSDVLPVGSDDATEATNIAENTEWFLRAVYYNAIMDIDFDYAARRVAMFIAPPGDHCVSHNNTWASMYRVYKTTGLTSKLGDAGQHAGAAGSIWTDNIRYTNAGTQLHTYAGTSGTLTRGKDVDQSGRLGTLTNLTYERWHRGGMEAWYRVFGLGAIDAGAFTLAGLQSQNAGVADSQLVDLYRYVDWGDARIVFLDTRKYFDFCGTQPASTGAATALTDSDIEDTTSVVDNSKMTALGLDQKAWLQKAINNYSGSLIVFVSGGPMFDVYNSEDNWNGVQPNTNQSDANAARFRNERNTVLGWTKAKGVSCISMAGDRHVAFGHNRFDASGYATDNTGLDQAYDNWLFEVSYCAAGMGGLAIGSNNDDVGFRTNFPAGDGEDKLFLGATTGNRLSNYAILRMNQPDGEATGSAKIHADGSAIGNTGTIAYTLIEPSGGGGGFTPGIAQRVHMIRRRK